MELSVLITTYNCINYIDLAIESVLKQKKPHTWEILVGDDGSSDGTLDKINKWTELYPNNIKLYVMPRDGKVVKSGLRAARNRANLLNHANGKYIAFLDGDDQLLGEDKFEKQIDILDNDRKKEFSCVAHNIYAIESLSGKKYNMVEDSVADGPVDTKKYWNSMYFHTNTILFRSECKGLMLDDRYKDFLNDNFITYLILQYGNIYYINDVFAQYNITGNGLWTGKRRVYGCFRNMMLYDLERQINPKLRKSSYKRHLYDILYISRNYNTSEDSNVFELFDGVEKSDFPKSLLLAKIDDISLVQRVRRRFFTDTAEIYNIADHLLHFKEYIKRKRNVR